MLLKKFKEVLLLSLSSVNVILATLQTWLSRALTSSFSSVLARRTKCMRQPCTLLYVTFSNIHRFKDFFFTDRLSNKPFLIWLNTSPPHLKYVAILPYKSPLIAWHSNRLQPQPNMHRKYVSRATIIGLLLLDSREGWSIAMCLCLSDCLAHISQKSRQKLHQLFGSVLFWRQRNTLSTSAFVDDVIFSTVFTLQCFYSILNLHMHRALPLLFFFVFFHNFFCLSLLCLCVKCGQHWWANAFSGSLPLHYFYFNILFVIRTWQIIFLSLTIAATRLLKLSSLQILKSSIE